MRAPCLSACMLCGLLLILPGCRGLSASRPGRDSPVAGVPSAETITVSAGETFKIELPENPTTGYLWVVSQSPTSGVAVLESSRYRPPSGGVVGAGGQKTFTFRAVGPGDTRVAFEYRRPWEKNVRPAQVRQYILIVK